MESPTLKPMKNPIRNNIFLNYSSTGVSLFDESNDTASNNDKVRGLNLVEDPRQNRSLGMAVQQDFAELQSEDEFFRDFLRFTKKKKRGHETP